MPRNFVSLFGSGGDVLPVVGGGGVAPTIVQSIANTTGADVSFVDTTFASPVTAGNLIVVCAWGRASGGDVVYSAGMLTQNAGTATLGAITLDAATANNNPGTNSAPSAIWSAPITGSGTSTMRIGHGSWTAGSTRSLLMLFEVGLVDVSGARVNAAITAIPDNTSTVQSGNIATGGAGAIFGVFGCSDPPAITITEDAAFTLGVESQGTSFDDGSIIYRLVSTNTTDSADWATSGNVYAAICAVAYKAATP